MRLSYLITLALLTPVANAATFNVSTTPELREALNTAATNGEDDTIILAEGTYKTTDDGKGAFAYVSNESNSLTLEGLHRESVILDGAFQHEIINHNSTAENSPLVLRGISFVNGVSNSNAGAINSNFDIHITDCLFEDNEGVNGGAIHQWASKELVINNTNFESNTASRAGGAIFTIALLNINNSNFLYNQTLTNNGLNRIGGGAIYSRSTISTVKSSIVNTKFIENVSSSGRGGALNITGVLLNNVELIGNSSTYSDGAVSGDSIQIENSLIKNNSSEASFGVGWLGSSDIVNSIIINNTSTDNSYGVIQTYGSVVNTVIANNSAGLMSNAASIVNSVFYANGDADVLLGSNGSKTLSGLYNNYLNTSLLGQEYFGEGNVFDSTELGFVDEAAGDYRLTDSSDLIDAGTTNFDGVAFPEVDKDGNFRVSGGTIDIGPYEFNTTRPNIDGVTYSGEAIEQSELTFSVDYSLSDGRSVQSVEYDYLDDGHYSTSDVYTYNNAGTYTVTVKVTDDAGEFSTTSFDVVIQELPWAEMTYEQKLVKAIAPEYYDDLMVNIQYDRILAIDEGKQYVQDNLAEFSLVTEADKDTAVAQATSDGIASGKQYVQDNLAEFSLVTVTDKDTAVLQATTDGIASGKQYVQDNPAEFALVSLESMAPSSSELEMLGAGWTLNSTRTEITDLSMFSDAKVIWIYHDGKWLGWSSNQDTLAKIEASANYEVINNIPANSGIWVSK